MLKSTITTWRCPTNQAARYAHFYTGDFGENVDPYGVEKLLARLETRWAIVLRDIIQCSNLPPDDTENFANLLQFVAFQAMRTPSTREYIGTLVDENSKMELVHRLADGRDWEGFVRHLTDSGESVTITREELLESARRGEFIVSANKEWTIQTQLRAAIILMLHLAEREWSLFSAAESANDFVCSDAPVCVTSEEGEIIRDRGFCEPRSIVTIPLGRRYALAGFYEGRLDMEQSEREVAAINTMTIEHCRQIFSADEEFRYLRADGQISGAADFVSAAAKGHDEQ